MDLSDLGVYLYGSELTQRALPESDVDLILITKVPCTKEYAQVKIAPLVIQKFPNWLSREFDFQYLPASVSRPTRAKYLQLLGFLHQAHSKPILGSDLLVQCYRPTLQDHLLSRKKITFNRLQDNHGGDAQFLYDKATKTKDLKFLHGLTYTLMTFRRQIEAPSFQFYSVEELNEPLMDHVHSLTRNQWHYKIPQSEADLKVLYNLCFQISKLAQELDKHFEKNEGHQNI